MDRDQVVVQHETGHGSKENSQEGRRSIKLDKGEGKKVKGIEQVLKECGRDLLSEVTEAPLTAFWEFTKGVLLIVFVVSVFVIVNDRLTYCNVQGPGVNVTMLPLTQGSINGVGVYHSCQENRSGDESGTPEFLRGSTERCVLQCDIDIVRTFKELVREKI